MTIKELRQVTHSAFYRIVRIASPLRLDDFLEATVAETMPADASPTGWPDFWWESIAVEIQSAVMTRLEYIRGFDAGWLKQNKSKPWKEVTRLAGRKLGPLA